MEEHRLTQMPENYDKALFNQLFKDTEGLRRKLTYQVDAKRFGVTQEDIYSWFSIKFIHAFNRYFGNKDKDLLKGHIISSLMFFKNRILRFSYSQKAQIHNTVDIQEVYSLKETLVEHEYNERELFLKIALAFIRERISYEAFQVLEIELNPPLYILEQLAESNKTSNTKIPSSLVADYLGLGNDEKSIRYVNTLRKEIQGILIAAKGHFDKLELV